MLATVTNFRVQLTVRASMGLAQASACARINKRYEKRNIKFAGHAIFFCRASTDLSRL